MLEHRFYFGGLIVLATVSIYAGVNFRRFSFLVYGTIYGYIGVSTELLRNVHDFSGTLLYVMVSGMIVIGALVTLSRHVGREE